MSTEKFCLKWNDFESNISSAFKDIRDEKDFFDVTLACDDDQLQAHKVILSACSPFFRNVLKRNPHQHPLLYLKGVKYTDLQSVLNFMYHGEVNVAQDELNSFLAVAEELRVKGLTQNNQSSSSSKKDSAPKSPPPRSRAAPEPSPAPPPKRSRPNPPAPPPQSSYVAAADDDDIQEVVPVKSEPRDNPIVSVDPYGGGGAAVEPAHHPAPNNHQLATEEDANYDESYDDYGQYDQSYDASMMDPNMTGDSNKGGSCVADLDSYLQKTNFGYSCTFCGKLCSDKSACRNHVESMHLPSSGYHCSICAKFTPTKNALKIHMCRYHRK